MTHVRKGPLKTAAAVALGCLLALVTNKSVSALTISQVDLMVGIDTATRASN